MIKIINGKRYNTDTAEVLYEHDNGRYVDDFRYRSKTLYRTQSGAYFLRHAGGPMTDLAVSVGSGGTSGSQTIEAVTDDDAYRFLEAHSDADRAQEMIDRYFADRLTDA